MTLDPDTAALIRKRMAERRVSFKQALNDVIREGFAFQAADSATRFQTETADLGLPAVNLDHALSLVGELEDEELVRKTRAGK